jgi:hypothetical protein
MRVPIFSFKFEFEFEFEFEFAGQGIKKLQFFVGLDTIWSFFFWKEKKNGREVLIESE